MITFECPHCRQRLITPAEYAGQEGGCPRCTWPVRVPTAAGAAVVEQQQTAGPAEPVSYPALDADPLLVPAEGRDGALASGAAPVEPVATPHAAQPETVTSE